MSSSNQRPGNRGFRSVLQCAISQYRQVPSRSAPEPKRRLCCNFGHSGLASHDLFDLLTLRVRG